MPLPYEDTPTLGERIGEDTPTLSLLIEVVKQKLLSRDDRSRTRRPRSASLE